MLDLNSKVINSRNDLNHKSKSFDPYTSVSSSNPTSKSSFNHFKDAFLPKIKLPASRKLGAFSFNSGEKSTKINQDNKSNLPKSKEILNSERLHWSVVIKDNLNLV